MGPVCAPEDRPRGGRRARAGRSAEGGWDVLLAERLASPEVLPGEPRAARAPERAEPGARIDGMSWDDFLASKSSNFRQQARRRERKLAERARASLPAGRRPRPARRRPRGALPPARGALGRRGLGRPARAPLRLPPRVRPAGPRARLAAAVAARARRPAGGRLVRAALRGPRALLPGRPRPGVREAGGGLRPARATRCARR